jgi:mRNA interferase HigB
MRVCNRSTVQNFWERHPLAEEPLRRWLKDAKAAQWSGPGDIKATYASASFVGTDRVVFNIGGNSYRLICRMDYTYKVVFIRFLGTHREYDDVDAATI